MAQPFLDSELSHAERDMVKSRFVVIPVPYEASVSYGGGTSKGPQAILEASDQLERQIAGKEPCSAGIWTYPFIDTIGSPETVMARIEVAVATVLAQDQIPVVLGGEHSITYGAAKAALAYGPIGIIQIDAHADLREAYQGQRHSHASVMQLLAEEHNIPIVQFGIRAQSEEERERAKRLRIHQHFAEDLVIDNVCEAQLPTNFPKRVWISFDVDGLDPSEMPATGTPVPGGLRYTQALRLIETALQGRSVAGMDIVELAPIAGQPGWDFTAASVVYRLMAAALPTTI